jgi:hypothetical protein
MRLCGLAAQKKQQSMKVADFAALMGRLINQ